jgi:hypothetical protein
VDTQEALKGSFRFIILIPHRDALVSFEEYKRKLFSIGYDGAYSFPLTSPLAAVSRPFNRNELRELAMNIRVVTNEKDGKILSLGAAVTNYCTTPLHNESSRLPSGKFTFFGPGLNVSIEENLFPQTAKTKILHIFSPPVLCATLLGSDEKPHSEEMPPLSFRAASLANLAIRPLDYGANLHRDASRRKFPSATGYSFEWRIGATVWLPRK